MQCLGNQFSVGLFTQTAAQCVCEHPNWQQWFPRCCITWRAASRRLCGQAAMFFPLYALLFLPCYQEQFNLASYSLRELDTWPFRGWREAGVQPALPRKNLRCPPPWESGTTGLSKHCAGGRRSVNFCALKQKFWTCIAPNSTVLELLVLTVVHKRCDQENSVTSKVREDLLKASDDCTPQREVSSSTVEGTTGVLWERGIHLAMWHVHRNWPSLTRKPIWGRMWNMVSLCRFSPWRSNHFRVEMRAHTSASQPREGVVVAAARGVWLVVVEPVGACVILAPDGSRSKRTSENRTKLRQWCSGLIHTGRACIMQANGTYCRQWECSHCMQATSKEKHSNLRARRVWCVLCELGLSQRAQRVFFKAKSKPRGWPQATPKRQNFWSFCLFLYWSSWTAQEGNTRK